MRFRQANPWWRRLLRRWRQWRGAELVKHHEVHLVRVDGIDCKRVRFVELAAARQAGLALAALAPLQRFPDLLRQDGAELWTRFVPGTLARPKRAADRLAVAEFFVDLYSRQTGLIDSRQPLQRANGLAANLSRLKAAGRLDPAAVEPLLAVERRWRPQHVLLGYDYIDPIARNFVLAEGRAIAIDIEALLPDQPLGSGLAKAELRWMAVEAALVLDRIDGPRADALRAQYRWVQLCFLANYFVDKLRQRKPGKLRMTALTDLLSLR